MTHTLFRNHGISVGDSLLWTDRMFAVSTVDWCDCGVLVVPHTLYYSDVTLGAFSFSSTPIRSLGLRLFFSSCVFVLEGTLASTWRVAKLVSTILAGTLLS